MLKDRKLKNLLIYPRFQLTLVMVNLIIMTACYGLVFYQVHDSFGHLVEIAERLRIPSDSAFFRLMDHHLGQINIKLYIAAGIGYAFSVLLTLLISHKASGPLYRLESYFKDMEKNGYTGKVEFRKGDYYFNLPSIINKGIEKIFKV